MPITTGAGGTPGGASWRPCRVPVGGSRSPERASALSDVGVVGSAEPTRSADPRTTAYFAFWTVNLRL